VHDSSISFAHPIHHEISHGKIRAVLGVCLAVCLVSLSAPGGETPALPRQLKAPVHGLDEVGWQNVDLNGSFWGPRLAIHHQTTIPHVLDMLEERKHISNFDVAAKVIRSGAAIQAATDSNQATKALEGDDGNQNSKNPAAPVEGEIIGHSAFDSDLHKALEGACYTLGHCGDPVLQQRVDGILARVLAAQEKDGYLVSYFTAKEPQNRWVNMRLNHELYNAGHFFEFAVADFLLHGRTRALDSARRFADHIDRTFGHGKRYEVCGHQEVELALVKLYRATGEKRYLDLCRFFVDERGHAHGMERKPFTEVFDREPPKQRPDEPIREYRRRKWSTRNGRMQDHKPLLQQTEAVGHAVRAGYIYSAMADLARFSEAPEYAEAVRILWQDVVRHHLYITGGLGTAQYGDEGFGDPYLLPNKTYCESCACIANVLWQHRMNLMDGDAKYADVMELALYNSALSGMSLSGDAFFYQNPLESRAGAERSKWIGLACCPTNLARFTPQVGGLVYAKADGKLDVNLFAAGGSDIDMGGQTVKVRQDTDYPWNGEVKLAVSTDAPVTFDLRLRMPGWARGNPVSSDLYRFDSKTPAAATITVNGEAVDAVPGGDGYVSISRAWKTGDSIGLDLPMPVRRVYAHGNVAENRGKVALMRGPVVYCLEGIDNPGVDLFKVTLPRDAELTATHRPDLLNGVTVVQTTGRDDQGRPVKLTAIPYFAWANRAKCPMNVWLLEAD
jgi:DUF1680 family protein